MGIEVQLAIEKNRLWLLDSDPALRWQVERDLLGSPQDVWEATREATTTNGMAKRLLDLQDPDGQWAAGAYFPGGWDFEGPESREPGQPWTATTWTLNTLRDWGVPAKALAATADKLEANSHWEYDNLPYWGGEVDACINAFTLANGTWLGRDMSDLALWFVEHQMKEGGWNCEWVEGSTRASFHSTINSLFGILYYEQHTGDERVRAARHAAHAMLRTSICCSEKVCSVRVVVNMWAPGCTYSPTRSVMYTRRCEHSITSEPQACWMEQKLSL